jgi:hypothetical protein
MVRQCNVRVCLDLQMWRVACGVWCVFVCVCVCVCVCVRDGGIMCERYL